MAQKDASPGTAKIGCGLSLLPAVISSAVGWIVGQHSRQSAWDIAHGIHYGSVGGVIYGALFALTSFALAWKVVRHSRRYWVAVAVSLAVGIMGAIMGVRVEEYHGP